MDAFLATQVESLMVFSIVIAAFLLRFIIVQLAMCAHRKSQYLYQIDQIDSTPIIITKNQTYAEVTIISTANTAFPIIPTDYSVV